VLCSFPAGGPLLPVLRLLVELGASHAQVAQQALRAVIKLPASGRRSGRSSGASRPLPARGLEPYFEHLSQLDLRGYFALARDLFSHDASDLLEQVLVPALVVAAERDLFAPAARSREMAARIPGAELLVLREGSHAALVEQPELVALTLEKLLARIEAGATSAGR